MFRSLMTVIRELYLYLTKVIFMLKHSVKLRRYIYIYIYILVSLCTAHNTRVTLQHDVTSRDIHKDIILLSVLT